MKTKMADETAPAVKEKKVRAKKEVVSDPPFAFSENEERTQEGGTDEVTLPAVSAAPSSSKGKKKEKEKEKDKKKDKKKGKEAVLIRFERDQLAQIDARAESLGLNRASWLRMTVSQVLAKN